MNDFNVNVFLYCKETDINVLKDGGKVKKYKNQIWNLFESQKKFNLITLIFVNYLTMCTQF